MQTKPYTSKMADINENITTITVPVIPAQSDPVFTRFSAMSPRARSYKAERGHALAAVRSLINAGYESPNFSAITKERALWKAGEFGLITLKVLTAEFSEGDGPQRLVEFLYNGDPDNFAGLRYSYNHFPNREITIRELAVFGRQFPNINEKMMFLLLEGLRTSYPMFAREDLTELRGEEARSFMSVLFFTVDVYEKMSSGKWKDVERSTWNSEHVIKEAQCRTPRFNERFIDLLIERPERHGDIMRYLWLNNTEFLTVGRTKVEEYLDSPAGASSTTIPTLSSIATDARLLLGSFVRLGRSKIGI